MPTPLPYVNFGPHGRFTPSGAFRTTAGDIDALAQYVRDQNLRRVTLHFHGGLIAEKTGIEIAGKMVPVYQAAGSLPLSIVWETGLLETVRTNVTTIHQTKLFRKLLTWVVKKAAARLGVGIESKGVGLEMSTLEIEAQLALPSPFETSAIGVGARGGAGPINEASIGAIENDVTAELEHELDGDLEFAVLVLAPGQPAALRDAMSTTPPGSKSVLSLGKAALSLAKTVVRVLKRFIRQRDHDFYPTVIEELLREYYLADLGEWIWTGMKDTGEDMWRSNDGLAGDNRHAGRYLIEALARVQADTGVVLDLVGHSAGSVAVCRLLAAVAAGAVPVKFRTIVLLAPAVRSGMFLTEIARHPERYERLRIYTMSDAFETQDHLATLFFR